MNTLYDSEPSLVRAGKREKITITNDKGRLSQEEIDRMVLEAEEFADQDKAIKEKIDARNALETYCYNMKSTVGDKLGDKLEEDEKETVRGFLGNDNAAHSASAWYVSHSTCADHQCGRRGTGVDGGEPGCREGGL